ncbi:peptidyl-prolyl cis-trans isomerase PASTICCINO1 [Iris pallida]|uniref:Peptidyl-prolyl cis-trans isomerase PASTICCINO1 n=1 Tax=Iris pallida TaxID=29817 RepID=A0AAX6HM19_IRIPA|nr:peptidyl-prolyl cis-trans isomerase PASTICCINO1 [Iris pallida]
MHMINLKGLPMFPRVLMFSGKLSYLVLRCQRVTGYSKRERLNLLRRNTCDLVLREYNHVNPQDDEEGKIFLNSRNSLHLNVAACLQKMGEYRKSIETCNKVIEANPAHVKALYRRGMSYMLLGDFDEARKDFNQMIKFDKSSEPDASAALLKLKQKEQEVEKKARKQFKGLFDKKPGEISEVGVESKVEKDTDNENQNDEAADIDDGPTQLGEGQAPLVREAERIGFFARLWPTGRRFLTGLGLNRCTIL